MRRIVLLDFWRQTIFGKSGKVVCIKMRIENADSFTASRFSQDRIYFFVEFKFHFIFATENTEFTEFCYLIINSLNSLSSLWLNLFPAYRTPDLSISCTNSEIIKIVNIFSKLIPSFDAVSDK